MADNIKTYSASGDTLRPTNQGAEAFEMEGRHVEAAYAAAGQEIAAPIERYQTMSESADVMKQLSDLEIKKTQDMATAKSTMDPHDPNAAGDFMGQYDDALSKITDNIGMPAVREMAQKQVQDFKTRGTINFIDMQSQAAAADTLQKTDATLTNYANLGQQDPTNMQTGIDGVNAMAQHLEASQKQAFINHGTAQISDSTAEGIVGRVEGMKVYDPAKVQAAKDYINDPNNNFVKYMSPAKFAEVNNRLDNARRSGDQTTIAGMELNSPALLDQVKKTGQPGDDLVAMQANLRATGKPDGIAAADKLAQETKNAQGFYTANQAVIKTPGDQLQKLSDDAKAAFENAPTGTDTAVAQARYNQTVEAIKVRNEAFHGGDPAKQAGWELDNNPAVASAYQAFRSNPNTDTFFQYYQKSFADQHALEPGQVPSVLTTDMIQDAHGAINDIARDPKTGPQTAVERFGKMANLYGSAWPQIAGDLRKKGVFNGDQMIMAQLAGKPNAQGYVEPLARASVLTKEQLDTAGAIHGVKMEDARTAVRGEVSDLVGSMGNINNKDEMIDDMTNAAAKVMQVTGKQDAYSTMQSMFLDRFQFTGSGKTIRIPTGAGLNSDAIGHGSESVLNAIDKHDLVIPPSAGSLGAINQKEAWIDAVKQNGVWYTKPDGSGAMLYDGSDTGNPVMENINGRKVPVTLNWSELQRLGQTQTISADEATRREEMAQRQAGH